jgi:hypothetical protein
MTSFWPSTTRIRRIPPFRVLSDCGRFESPGTATQEGRITRSAWHRFATVSAAEHPSLGTLAQALVGGSASEADDIASFRCPPHRRAQQPKGQDHCRICCPGRDRPGGGTLRTAREVQRSQCLMADISALRRVALSPVADGIPHNRRGFGVLL